MDTKTISEFVGELRKCSYYNLGKTGDLAEFTYNGIGYCEGPESYHLKLEELFLRFKMAVIEMLPGGGAQIHPLWREIKALSERYYDVPDSDTLAALEKEYLTNKIESIARSIKEVKFLQQMHSQQVFFIKEALSFLEENMKDEMRSICKEQQIPEAESPKTILYGVDEVCDAFPSLKKHKVRDRKWREMNNFPDHQDCLGGKCTYYSDEVQDWIKTHK